MVESGGSFVAGHNVISSQGLGGLGILAVFRPKNAQPGGVSCAPLPIAGQILQH